MDRRLAARFALAAAVAATSAIAAFGGYMFLVGTSSALLEPDDPQLVAHGEAIYMEHCASCHGRNLEGQPDWQTQDKEGFLPAPPHDESGHTWHHPDTLLFKITKLGIAQAANLKDYKTRMPAFRETLSDDDIVAALSYIKSRWPEDMRRRHDQLNRAYEHRASSAR
ncbi:cytochrome c [Mesorhizobium sp. WSM2561]|uniref:c-type cytochrome n=1 Tax=Mesorhizobium sp. WSM2561 TaxID=1040985 RepID=UPI0004876D02|nr:cytochrome c [Mesorhizobium sp. WSM2561]